MPSVYTIEGAPTRRRKKKKKKLTPAQRRFAKIASRCSIDSRNTGRSYRACMSRELKK